MPLISVIVTVYNTERYIEAAVQSILNQTITDFELIIINDASTDRTWEILQSFNDERIVLVNNETNQGIPKNANTGLKLAKGDYIAKMDADDISHPMRFERQLAYFNAHPDVVICGSWAQIFGADDVLIRTPVTHDEIKAGLLFLNVIFNPAVMFKSSIYHQFGLSYNEHFPVLEDYTLWLDAVDKVKFANVPEILLKYRVHNQNISVFKKNNQDMLNDYHHKIYSRFFDKLNLAYTIEDLVRHRKIGLKQYEEVTASELDKCLTWLEKVCIQNKKVKYLNQKELIIVAISNVLYLLKKSKSSLKVYLAATKSLLKISGLSGPFIYLQFRLIAKANLKLAERF
jgi:glycosyltransferase involved in cell wall biosynthesis